MRLRGLLLVAAVALMLMGICVPHASAISWSDWEGKWFKVNVRLKGYCDDGGRLLRENDRAVVYIQLKTWNDTDGEEDADYLEDYFTATLWHKDDEGVWTSIDIDVVFIAGRPHHFIGWFFISDGGIIDVLIKIKGIIKKGGILHRGKALGLGGLLFEADEEDEGVCAQGLKLTGRTVSKPPFDVGE
jgi:hypothetical protein